MGGEENKKRKRGGDAYKNAYENVSIAPHHFPEDQPGITPRSFFKDSYDVTISPKQQQEKSTCTVVIHQHANGLCVVTVGDAQARSMDQVQSVTFQVQEAPQSMSANNRRKIQQKMLRGSTPADSQGIVTPHTILAHMTCENGTTIQIPAGVWGTVLELNTNVTPELLKKDPLLDGYLAIIMPTGPFPPPLVVYQSQQDESDEEPRKKPHVTTCQDDNE
jgi:hypothetical protein